MNSLRVFSAVVVLFFSLLTCHKVEAQPVKVTLEKADGSWMLKRDGNPYYVNGAGGNGDLALLKKCGGNSNRTWGVDDHAETLARLDEAHKNGISVSFGMWLGHERHGFDYSDEAAVKKQFDTTIELVKRYKDHPAILVWGVGNEMEGYETGDNPKIWQHIESLCKEIKKIDPNHPTMSVVAEVKQTKVDAINKWCPSLDILGINSYGISKTLPKRYKELGGTKPYIVTEFGPVGTWEVKENNIKAIEEPMSSEKATMYRDAYRIFKSDKNCLGSYAFIWGNKQEGTATWFGMLLADGRKLPVVDAMAMEWSGKPVANKCPIIESFELEGPNSVKAGDKFRINMKASDPENKTLSATWWFTREAAAYVTGGDPQAAPPNLSDMIKREGMSGATIKAPTYGGKYRAYVFVNDGDSAATANIPIYVEGKKLESPGMQVSLPYTVLDEPSNSNEYAPSGYMGNAAGLKLDHGCTTNPKSGATCTECQYTETSGWGGVVWQHPDNDWGDKPGGLDLSGAKKLTFWARGNSGGEKIKFGFGLIGKGKPYFDTGKKETELILDKEWKQYTFDLNNLDLRRIKTGFYFSLGSEGKPFKFYLDAIKYE